VIPTRDGQACHENGGGDVWRTFVYVEGVQTHEAVQTPAQAFQAGNAFGEFQSLLAEGKEAALDWESAKKELRGRFP